MHTQKNGREISSGELRHGGLCGPIGVDLSATRDKGYGTGFHGDVRVLRGDCLVFSLENLNPPSNRMSSKYISSEEIRTGPIESLDIRKLEIQQFAKCKL